MDVVTYALSRKYTDNSIAGTSGVLAGKNCTIASITPVDGGNLVTFEWVADDSTTHTDTMFVQDGILGENDIAPTYDSTVTYSEGNLVVYNNELYRCTSATTGEFDPSDWESISINEILSEIEIALAGKADSGDVPTSLSQLSDDSAHRLVTDTEKATWNGKQNALTFDDVPIASSNNPVKSGGVYTALEGKANSSDLATVATSGSYNDLSNTPTIPSDAGDIDYDNTESGLTADDVQGAIDEVVDTTDDIQDKISISGYFKTVTGFDPLATITGYIKADGTFQDGGSGWARTDYIKTAEGALITATLKGYSTNPIVAFYDANKQYLSDESIKSDQQRTLNIDAYVPSGVAYVIFVSQTSAPLRAFEVEVPVNSISEGMNSLSNDIYAYKGLKVMCMGDSLTAGRDGLGNILTHNYPYYMRKSRIKKCIINNAGEVGSSTVTYWNNKIKNFDIDNTIDVVLMMWGTNGGLVSNTLDTDVEPYDDYEDYADTGVGDFCKIIEYTMEQTNNNAQIVLLTPPYNGDASINSRVIKAQDVVKAIAERYNLPVIDMFQCGIGEFNYSTFMPDDSVHFSQDGYKWIGTYIGSCLDSIISKRVI